MVQKGRQVTHHPLVVVKGRYKNRQERFDNAILKELESTNNAIKSVVTSDNEDEVSLYCKSIIPTISSFPVKKKRLVMIKVSQLLFELEFEHE